MRDFRQLRDCRLFVDKLLLVQVAKFRTIKSNSEVRTKHPLSILSAEEIKWLLKFELKPKLLIIINYFALCTNKVVC